MSASPPTPRRSARPLPRIVPRIVTRNGRLKLAALGLAVFLWALLRTEPTSGVEVFTVPVRAQVGDLDWVIAGEPDPSTVQVRLRGPTEELLRIARQGATLRVPLDSVASADTVVQLRRDWVALDGTGVVVEDIAPATVHLLLQPTLSTVLPLRLRTRGALSAELALAAPVGIDPPSARVRGPAHRVRALDSIALGPLDLGDLSESGSYRLDVDTTGLGELSVTPLSATAAVRLEPAVERTLASVPVMLQDGEDLEAAARSFVFAPTSIEVRLAGARTPVTGTREEEVRAVVLWESVAGLPPGEARVVPIELRGVPGLVRAFSGSDSVLVQRRPR